MWLSDTNAHGLQPATSATQQSWFTALQVSDNSTEESCHVFMEQQEDDDGKMLTAVNWECLNEEKEVVCEGEVKFIVTTTV